MALLIIACLTVIMGDYFLLVDYVHGTENKPNENHYTIFWDDLDDLKADFLAFFVLFTASVRSGQP